MKKYKLIKTYPGSPSLGCIPKYNAPIYEYGSYRFSKDLIENNPEFWEEVKEKYYEILTYNQKPENGNRTYHLQADGTYKDPNSTICWKANAFDSSNPIISIKRLSDGEIFTVGDKFKSKGSPPTIDTITSFKPFTHNEQDLMEVEYGPKNYRHNLQFIEKYVEKTYEVLSFMCCDNHGANRYNQEFILQKNGNYKWSTLENSYESLLACPIHPLTGGYKIWSIKRLSDGEVFTIGDKTNFGNLTGFKICKNCLEIEHNPSGEDLNDSCIGIEGLKKASKPLFTTEDGVEITDPEQIVYRIYSDYAISTPKAKNIFPELSKVYSTGQAAENYIIENKPCISYNDIINLYKKDWCTTENVKKLAKEKLKL